MELIKNCNRGGADVPLPALPVLLFFSEINRYDAEEKDNIFKAKEA